MYYQIREILQEVPREDIIRSDVQFVAVITSDEWMRDRERFEMGIDIEPDLSEPDTTKAEVNYDSLTGTFSIPDRKGIAADSGFAFALDEKGIVFIDDSDTANRLIRQIIRTKKWRFPSLERFLYDFLEQIVHEDRRLLQQYELQLDAMEDEILEDSGEVTFEQVYELRNGIRDLRVHYEQLLDFSQELEENENNFFKTENLRYFRLFTSRVERLRDAAIAVSDHATQIPEIYKAHLELRQNRIMTVLTVVTTIFMPLTLIAGWYGMNFLYMPELGVRWAYPVVIVISILIVVLSIIFFKKKKWL
ncbi:MAG: magnesium transporter CorA [Eubacterium sp.]|nr:magnesium transporter CorA [Eubacterium sp.]